MGPKYEFTDETLNWDGHILHRIRRLSDNKIGGWIEKEENLSQEGNCWVYNEAKIYDDAKVCGNAHIYDNAIISDNAIVYGNAKVFDNVEVYDNAEVYGNVIVSGEAEVSGNVKVSGNTKVCDVAKVHDDSTKVAQDFIYKIDDSDKLNVKTEYSSIDEYFNSSYQNDIKLDTLIIGTIDTKIPIIKLEKIEKDKQLKYKFIVDLTTENEDHFLIQSFIETKEQLSQKLTQTVDALNQYPEFAKYTDDLSECI